MGTNAVVVVIRDVRISGYVRLFRVQFGFHCMSSSCARGATASGGVTFMRAFIKRSYMLQEGVAHDFENCVPSENTDRSRETAATKGITEGESTLRATYELAGNAARAARARQLTRR